MKKRKLKFTDADTKALRDAFLAESVNCKIINNIKDTTRLLNSQCYITERKMDYPDKGGYKVFWRWFEFKHVWRGTWSFHKEKTPNCWHYGDGSFNEYINDGKTKYLSEVVLVHLQTI